MSVLLREMEERDLAAVRSLEENCFSLPWDSASLRYALGAPGSLCYVALETVNGERPALDGGGGAPDGSREEGALLGYAMGRVICENCEVYNIAVVRERRREGIGGALLARLLAGAREAGCAAALLEVRESNREALALYAREGFTVNGRRRGYYHAPREDALLMRAIL